MNSLEKGRIAELMVLVRLAKGGYEIAVPYGQQKGWDVLVKVNGKWEQWQVKTIRYREGRRRGRYLTVGQMTYNGGKYERAMVGTGQDLMYDWLIGVDIKSEEMWKVPAHYVSGKKGIYLQPGRFEWAESPQGQVQIHSEAPSN